MSKNWKDQTGKTHLITVVKDPRITTEYLPLCWVDSSVYGSVELRMENAMGVNCADCLKRIHGAVHQCEPSERYKWCPGCGERLRR